MKTLFQKSVPGRLGVTPKKGEKNIEELLPANFRREKDTGLPELSELDIIRHFSNLSEKNFALDKNFYPVGTCTMKYNPKFMETALLFKGFLHAHPHLANLPHGRKYCQGALTVLFEMEKQLCEITGMAAFSLQTMAGAQGEFAAALMMAAYHKQNGGPRKKIICPDSAHGTNPASAALAGFEVVTLPSKDGLADMEALVAMLDESIAGIMLTCPNTLGLFERNLPTISKMAKEKDVLLYCDGANMNAIMGRLRPGEAGFDLMHVNLHKTFGAPHGGGGPGAGPVGASQKMAPFLPSPRVTKDQDGKFSTDSEQPLSIGRMSPFFGNFGVILKSLAYLKALGGDGVARASSMAVLSANYLKSLVGELLDIPFGKNCMHEFVASAEKLLESKGIRAYDIAKALLDRGYHAPTIYFPLIVQEALMFEPTETESKETLDSFAADLKDILKMAEKAPDWIKETPVNLPVRRLDEKLAAKDLQVTEPIPI